MVVMMLEKVPTSLRGELTRWMIEPRAGVFVGTVSSLVRDKLWERACGSAGQGSCVLVHSSDTEQGFAVRTFGEGRREIVDIEGLALVRLPAKP